MISMKYQPNNIEGVTVYSTCLLYYSNWKPYRYFYKLNNISVTILPSFIVWMLVLESFIVLFSLLRISPI